MKKVALTVLILVGLAGAAWSVQSYRTWKAGEGFRNYVNDVENLFVALQQYKEKVGSYPAGSNSEVVKALSGRNDRNVIVIVSNRIPVNEKGEYVDHWGTPLAIYFSGNSVLVRSAGPNKRFEDSRASLGDDIVLSN